METLIAPEHRSLSGCDGRTSTIRFCLDGRWRVARVHRCAPARGSTSFRELESRNVGILFHVFSSYPTSQMVSITYTLTM